MTIPVALGENSYDIILEQGCLQKAGEYLDLNRRVFIVTDDGVPPEYAQAVAAQAKTPVIHTVPRGEGSKSLGTYGRLLSHMLAEGFTRKDCVVAVGGGVVGDLAGFTAASYMRGIDFYNIPTTVLSQVDSSIGGKTAVNLDGIKNIVGAFWQPRRVLIDINTLATLPPRQLSNGLAEAVKMALTSDPVLFSIFESGNIKDSMSEIIERSLKIKRDVVQQDERETGLRKILNFGHTIGHGIESAGAGKLFHGECVAIGMLPMCSAAVRDRLAPVLEKVSLPVACSLDADEIYAAMLHDKKSSGGAITVIKVPAVGSFEICAVPPEELRPLIDEIVQESTL